MSDQTQHKTLQTTIDKLSTGQESVANQTDQLQLLYAIRNILSGERDFNEGYMFCNEVVCIRPLCCIAIFHSQLYFTTSIRISLKQTIIEHELSLSSCLSTGVFFLYSSRLLWLLLMITLTIVEISKTSAETLGVRCRDGPHPSPNRESGHSGK